MIEIKDVAFSYQEEEQKTGMEVLQNVSLQVKRGECVVLCGRSGCGKTTLLRMMNGLIPHFYTGNLQGNVTVDGIQTTEQSLVQISKIVGSVFQNPRSQFFHLDTTGEMAFNLENQNLSRQQMEERLDDTVERLDLEELMDRNIFKLSGGEKQRIACGAVYAALPEVIVLDEPSSNLDMESIRKLKKMLERMKKDGKTIVISEHRLWYLDGIADRYVYMEDGHIQHKYTRKEMLEISETERKHLGLRVVKKNQLYDVEMKGYKERRQTEVPGLEIENLTYRHKKQQVLHIPNLQIPQGAIVAVIGENGAGKTTLSLCLSGLLKHHGCIRIKGEKIPNKRLPSKMYLVMQEAGHQLFSDTVLGELTLNNAVTTETEAKEILDIMGLDQLEERHPGSLSGGQQQRLSIATALCMKRSVMLYDEPSSGQDGDNLRRTAQIICQANEQAVCSLVVSHDPELIRKCATHVLHIQAGEVKKIIELNQEGKQYMEKVFEENAKNTKQNKTGVSRILEFAGKYRSLLGISRILAAISALFLMGPFVCVYFATKELLEGLTVGFDTGALLQWGVLALVLELLGLVLDFIALLCSHKVAFHTEKNLKTSVLRHLSTMPMGYFEENPSGKIRKIIDENSAQMETYIAHQMPDLISAQVTTVVSLALMLLIDWKIGLPLLVLMAASFAFQMTMMGEKTMNFMKRYQDAQEEMNHEAVEYVRGIAVIKTFGQSVHSIRRFKEAIEAYRKDALAFTMACKPGYVGFNTVVNASFLVLVPVALVGLNGTGDMISFAEKLLFYLIFTPACASVLNKIMYMSNYKMQAVEAMRRLDMILMEKGQTEAHQPKRNKGNEICFEHVTFTYPTGESPAISDVSFTAKEGTVTALVGASGSGKTTIATLIPRFYDISQGRITLGGVELPEIGREELMRQVAFVFQNPKLLKATLEENIRGGCTDATREEILRAAHLAKCDDILEKMPQGLASVVGGKGTYLSGGEVQRIAIAKAILKDAPVVILDEATAFADPENEAQIQAALKELMKERTVLMVAHRLSTIQEADQILVMKEGCIMEHGTHEELLMRQGMYTDMWKDYRQTLDWRLGSEEEQVC